MAQWFAVFCFDIYCNFNQKTSNRNDQIVVLNFYMDYCFKSKRYLDMVINSNCLTFLQLELIGTEMPKHMDDTDFSFLDDLLPWAEAIPAICKK